MGNHLTSDSAYDNDPRVTSHDDGSYAVRAAGQAYRVDWTAVFGWAIYLGRQRTIVQTVSGDQAIHIHSADAAISLLIGDPITTAEVTA